VNGKVVAELGAKADPDRDHIKVDGKLINPKQPKAYIMLNKPAGFVTTMSDPEGRPIRCGPPEGCPGPGLPRGQTRLRH